MPKRKRKPKPFEPCDRNYSTELSNEQRARLSTPTIKIISLDGSEVLTTKLSAERNHVFGLKEQVCQELGIPILVQHYARGNRHLNDNDDLHCDQTLRLVKCKIPMNDMSIRAAIRCLRDGYDGYGEGSNEFRTFWGSLANFDTSQVTDFSSLFYCFKGPLDGVEQWNTSNATSMRLCFFDAHGLRAESLNQWDVTKVTDMESIFDGAVNFHGDISEWKPSACVNFLNALCYCPARNNPVNLLTIREWEDAW